MEPRKILIQPVLVAAILLFLPEDRAAAQIITNTFNDNFGNNTSNDWTTPANWTLASGAGTAPVNPTDKAVVDGDSTGVRNLVVNANDIHVGELEYVTGGSQLQRIINSSGSTRTLKIDTLTKGGAYQLYIRNNSGSLSVEIGNLNLNENIINLGVSTSLGGFTVTGTTTIAGAGNLVLSGVTGGRIALGRLDLAGHLILGGSGYSEGTVSVSSLVGNGYVEVSSSAGNNGTAGTLEINSTNATPADFSGILRNQASTQTAVLTVVKSGSGTQILSRSTGNTYSGTTTIEEGVLAVTNSSGSGLGTGAVEIKEGGILAGTGRIAPGSGNTITVENGGSVAPAAHLATGFATLTLDGASNGATTSILHMEQGSFFTFRLGAADASDAIAFTGYHAGGLTLFADGISVNGLGVQEGAFTLFTFDSVGGEEINSLAALLRAGTGFAGYDATFYADVNSILLNVVAIPEPGMAGLLTAAALLSGWRLRRRKSASRKK